MQNSTTILGIIEMRLKGISYDDCRNRYGVGNSTVNLIMTRYLEKGVPLEVLKQMPAEEVEASFYPPSNVRRKSEDIMPDYKAIYDRIHREGSKANLYFLWLRYKQEHPSGYQYTQFCHYFNQYVSTHHGSQSLRMAVERIPGERMYIDWVGDQPELLVDAQTGELRKVHIFVTTVGVSSMIYAEAFPNEKLPNFVAGTVHALDYYGAVPKYLVPDNLRAAVTKHTKDELILNSAYQDTIQKAYSLFTDCNYEIFAKSIAIFARAQDATANFMAAVRDTAYKVKVLTDDLKAEQDQKAVALDNLRKNVKDYPKGLLRLKHLMEPGVSNRRVMLRIASGKKEFPEYDYQDASVRDTFNDAAIALEKEGFVTNQWVKGRPVLLLCK